MPASAAFTALGLANPFLDILGCNWCYPWKFHILLFPALAAIFCPWPDNLLFLDFLGCNWCCPWNFHILLYTALAAIFIAPGLYFALVIGSCAPLNRSFMHCRHVLCTVFLLAILDRCTEICNHTCFSSEPRIGSSQKSPPTENSSQNFTAYIPHKTGPHRDGPRLESYQKTGITPFQKHTAKQSQEATRQATTRRSNGIVVVRKLPKVLQSFGTVLLILWNQVGSEHRLDIHRQAPGGTLEQHQTWNAISTAQTVTEEAELCQAGCTTGQSRVSERKRQGQGQRQAVPTQGGDDGPAGIIATPSSATGVDDATADYNHRVGGWKCSASSLHGPDVDADEDERRPATRRASGAGCACGFPAQGLGKEPSQSGRSTSCSQTWTCRRSPQQDSLHVRVDPISGGPSGPPAKPSQREKQDVGRAQGDGGQMDHTADDSHQVSGDGLQDRRRSHRLGRRGDGSGGRRGGGGRSQTERGRGSNRGSRGKACRTASPRQKGCTGGAGHRPGPRTYSAPPENRGAGSWQERGQAERTSHWRCYGGGFAPSTGPSLSRTGHDGREAPRTREAHSILGEADFVSRHMAPVLGICLAAEIRCDGIPNLLRNPFAMCDPRLAHYQHTADRTLDASEELDEWLPSLEIVQNRHQCQDTSRWTNAPWEVVYSTWSSSFRKQGPRLKSAVSFALQGATLSVVQSFRRATCDLAKLHRAFLHALNTHNGCQHASQSSASHADPWGEAPHNVQHRDACVHRSPVHLPHASRLALINHPVEDDSTGQRSGTYPDWLPASSDSSRKGTPQEHEGCPAVAISLPVPSSDIESFIRGLGEQTEYVFFDTVDHCRRRQLLEGWGIREIFADAIGHSVAQPITAASLLQPALPDLPPIQIVLDSANLPPQWKTVPIDLRRTGFRICTIGAPQDSSAFEIAFRASQKCRAPPRLSNYVARSYWEFAPPGTVVFDPFQPEVLRRGPVILCSPRPGSPSQSASTSCSSSSTAAFSETSSASDPHFAETSVHLPPHGDDFTVAFHAVGHQPWTHSFSRLATPEQLARTAAVHMQSVTGEPGWRTQFLWRQPVVRDIDLHCLLTPIRSTATVGGVFLADFRRIFGPQLRNLAALPVTPNTPHTADNMCTAASGLLEEWAIHQPDFDFVVTTARRGALLVPACEELCAVTETVTVVHQLPGLRQHMFSLNPIAQTQRGILTRATEEHGTVSTTSSTTPSLQEELPHHVLPLPPRNPLLVRLGIAGFGVFTVEFQGCPPAADILARTWAAAMQEGPLPSGLHIQLALCQPQPWVSHRELLIFAHNPAHRNRHVSIWLDMRPGGLLSFRRVPKEATPQDIIADIPGCRCLFRNGARWTGDSPLRDGDHVASSLVPQAPDARPSDFFVQRITDLGVLLLPMCVPETLCFESTHSFELDQDIARHEWQTAISFRARALGLTAEGALGRFIIIGQQLQAVGAFDPSVVRAPHRIEDVAAWARAWIFPQIGPFELHDTEGIIGGRRLYVITPPDLDHASEYIRIHVSGDAPMAFRVPHRAAPGQLALIAPISDALNTPVPGRPWYGTLFPSTEHHPAVAVLESTAPVQISSRHSASQLTERPVALAPRWRRRLPRLLVADTHHTPHGELQGDILLSRATAEALSAARVGSRMDTVSVSYTADDPGPDTTSTTTAVFTLP